MTKCGEGKIPCLANAARPFDKLRAGSIGFPLGFARGFGETGQAGSKIAKRGAASIMMVPRTIKGGPAGPVSALCAT
jgi:hypothetical protein